MLNLFQHPWTARSSGAALKEMAAIETELSDGSLFARDNARFNALTAKLDKLRDDKAAAEDRWLALAEEVEALG